MTPTAGRQGRPRRSREEVSRALIHATAALLAERSSGHVTVRDIAARAGVNPTLIHRYFGTKHNLMQAAIESAQGRMAVSVEQMSDVVEGAAGVVHAVLEEKEFVAGLARATLDGVLDDLPSGNPVMAGLVERFAAEFERRGTGGEREARVLVACLGSAAVGYALFGDFIRRGTGLDGEPLAQVEAELVKRLQDLARAALGSAASAG